MTLMETLTQQAGELRVENERLVAELALARQRNARLAQALPDLIRDTGSGVFTSSGAGETAAKAALLANEEAP